MAESGDRTRFFDRVREGRIEICALPFSMHTEAYSIDELARQLRFADELRGRFDVPIETAMQIDVPGATIGLLTSLVDADIRQEICVSFGLLGDARAWVGTHLEKHLEEARVEGENVRFVVPAGSLVSLAVDLEGICFLAEPKASFVTGADYRVDGGLLAALGVRLPE